MADNKGNIKEEWVVKLSADTYEFDNSMEKADDTLDEQKSNVKKLQKAYQSLYNWVRNTNRQFKNTGKKLGVNIKSFGNPYERYLSKNKTSKTHKPTIDDKPVEKFAKNAKDEFESVSDTSNDVAKDMKDNFKSATSDMKNDMKSVSEEMKKSSNNTENMSKQLLSSKKIANGLRRIMQTLKIPDLAKHAGYYSKEAEKIRKQIAKLESENKSLSEKKIPAKGVSREDIAFVERQIERLTSRLDSYRKKQEEIKSSNATKQQMLEYTRLSEQIERATQSLYEFKAQRDSMYTSGATLPQYDKNEAAIASLRTELSSIESQGQTVARSIAKNIGTQLKNALGKGVTSGVKVAKAGFTNLINTVKSAKKHISNFGKSLKSLTGSDAFLGSPMSPKGVFMFSQMWLQFSMISAIFEEVKRSIDNFAKSFEPFNDALSRTINSLRVFGAQITATFEPLVVVAVPYVEKLLDVLTKTADTLAQFTARLTGNQMYTKASKGNYNYAESLDKTSSGAKKATKAVKEYQNTVLGFDQLNKLNGVDDEDAEIGVDDAKLNKAQTQSTRLNKIADAIHKALSKKDYKGAGKAVADGVNEAFSWIKNVAGWEANSKRVTGALRHVIDFVNSLADEFKGTKAGQAIGDVANTVIESLKLLTEPTKGINFGLIGTRLGQMIKGAIDTVHWDSLGVSIVQSIQGMLAFVNGIISVPDFWVSIGTAIANGIQGMIKAYDPSKVADLVVNLVNGIAELLVTAFGGENAGIGAEIGAKLAETVNKVFAGLSPEQIANGINAFVNTITSTINTFIKNVDWSTVLSTIGTALKELDWLGIIEIVALFAIPKIPSVVLPLLGSAFSVIGKMGAKLLSGAGGEGGLFSSLGAKLFGGEGGAGLFSKLIPKLQTSGGKLLQTIGKIVGGINPIVAVALASVGTYAFTHFDEFKTRLSDTWSSIKEATESVWSDISSGLSTVWGEITTAFQPVADAFDNFKNSLKDLAESPFVQLIIDILSTLGEFLVATLLPRVTGMITHISTVISGIWNVIVSVVGGIARIVGSAITNVTNIISGALKVVSGIFSADLGQIWEGVKEIFTSIKDFIADTVGSIAETVGDVFGSIVETISELLTSGFETVSNWWKDIKGIFGDAWSGVKDFFTPDKKEKSRSVMVNPYSIPKLAGGGVVGDGQLFIANENGPELVGQHNGQTAVMNNMQIVTAVTRGVRDAMAEVLMTFSHNGGDGDGGDVVIMVDSEELARATLRGQRKLDKRNNPSVSFA